MKGARLFGQRNIRYEPSESMKILRPMDAVIRISGTCERSSELWPDRGMNTIRPGRRGLPHHGRAPAIKALLRP